MDTSSLSQNLYTAFKHYLTKLQEWKMGWNNNLFNTIVIKLLWRSSNRQKRLYHYKQDIYHKDNLMLLQQLDLMSFVFWVNILITHIKGIFEMLYYISMLDEFLIFR